RPHGLLARPIAALIIRPFAPLDAAFRTWLETRFQPLLAREAALYREVVTRLGAQPRRHQQLPESLRFVAEKTAHELNRRRVRFLLLNHNRLTSDNANENASAFLLEGVSEFETVGRKDGEGFDFDASADDNGGNVSAWAEKLLALAREHEDFIADVPELQARSFELAYALCR